MNIFVSIINNYKKILIILHFFMQVSLLLIQYHFLTDLQIIIPNCVNLIFNNIMVYVKNIS